MELESVFLSYIRHIFSKWTGFQAAIDEGMGGPYAREKEIWIAEEVENYFKRYDDIKPEDIVEYLGTMIENEFETYFEDGSLDQISENFCRAYQLSTTNPNAEMFQESNKAARTRNSQERHETRKTVEV
ncbi:pre-rRNA-processing protein TSR2 homolog [Uloborus diversus]|uniref:pre-rRNA-processing protein TSR2 homolog n=1 Tax=Uloborus diversus TaxID=327109 RepID=UPI002409B4B2|nr:pre-rRNA-processing protein TSR2 homolog [Uloborus diversus]